MRCTCCPPQIAELGRKRTSRSRRRSTNRSPESPHRTIVRETETYRTNRHAQSCIWSCRARTSALRRPSWIRDLVRVSSAAPPPGDGDAAESCLSRRSSDNPGMGGRARNNVWSEARAASQSRVFVMPCCEVRATAKTSHLGFRFFAHRPVPDNTCLWANQSNEHERLKAASLPGGERSWVRPTDGSDRSRRFMAGRLCHPRRSGRSGVRHRNAAL